MEEAYRLLSEWNYKLIEIEEEARKLSEDQELFELAGAEVLGLLLRLLRGWFRLDGAVPVGFLRGLFFVRLVEFAAAERETRVRVLDLTFGVGQLLLE